VSQQFFLIDLKTITIESQQLQKISPAPPNPPQETNSQSYSPVLTANLYTGWLNLIVSFVHNHVQTQTMTQIMTNKQYDTAGSA